MSTDADGMGMSLDDHIQRLKNIPFFAHLEPEALRLVAFAGDTRRYFSGQALFRRGEVSDGGYVVLAGKFALYPSDSKAEPASEIGPGALIGETALLASTERPVTAIALEDATVLKISRGAFQRVLQEFPQSAVRLRDALAARLTAFVDQLRAAEFSRHD